ncbi:MAG: hypothetical protein NVSMB57_04380 [Actinomycetota bacterium]
MSVRARPTRIPLQISIPSLRINARLLSVGITSSGLMDAPRGHAAWSHAFWYRGGGVPGAVGISTISGHVSTVRGRPSVFAHLRAVRPGAAIFIRDTRTGLRIRYVVVSLTTYSLKQLAKRSTLAKIFGAGPVTGRGALRSPDGLSHLSLITCAGKYSHGSYQSRLVVFATRIG